MPAISVLNARTIAAALGITDEQAIPLVDQPIQLSVGTSPTDGLVATHAARLLQRTFSSVGTDTTPVPAPAVELVIGAIEPRTAAPKKIYAAADRKCIAVASIPQPPSDLLSIPILALVCACYAAALVTRAAMGDALVLVGYRDINIKIEELLGMSADEFSALQTTFDQTYLAGAGAVGNAFIYAMHLMQCSGSLTIIDPKKVTEGILNRCLWYGVEDLGEDKAAALCKNAAPAFPSLTLTPFVGTVSQFRQTIGGELRRLIVGVDSRRTRRSLQTEIPHEVFDASTTGIEETVFHWNTQPSTFACMACIYNKTGEEASFERHVAEMLNVSLVELSMGFIDEYSASRIVARYSQLDKKLLIGRAFDSVFRELCSTQQLREGENRQVLPPFSFVSQLAGSILAIEFVRRTNRKKDDDFNYWRVSPWASPNVELRQMRERLAACPVCGNSDYQAVAHEIWGEAARPTC